MHALFLRNLTINPLILKVFAKTKVGETSALALSLKILWSVSRAMHTRGIKLRLVRVDRPGGARDVAGKDNQGLDARESAS